MSGDEIKWRATEQQQHDYRMLACRERRALYGGDCDGDGSCTECEIEMAEWFETRASKAARAAISHDEPEQPA